MAMSEKDYTSEPELSTQNDVVVTNFGNFSLSQWQQSQLENITTSKGIECLVYNWFIVQPDLKEGHLFRRPGATVLVGKMITIWGYGSFVLASFILSVYPTVTACEVFNLQLEAANKGSHPMSKRDVMNDPSGSTSSTYGDFEDVEENSMSRRRKRDDATPDFISPDTDDLSRFYSRKNLEYEDANVSGKTVCNEIIPAGGNAFESADKEELQQSSAVQDEETILGEKWVYIYVHMTKDQTLELALWCRSLDGNAHIIHFQLGQGSTIDIKVTGTALQEIKIPEALPAKATGDYLVFKFFADNPGTTAISHLVVKNKLPENEFTYIKPGLSYFYGRRGPTVHLKFWPEKEVELCYTEVKADPNGTPSGSYFMALGTSDVHFGIQKNDPNRRTVILSVWSEYQSEKIGTGDEIPKELKIEKLHSISGANVFNFGFEGYGTSIQHSLMWEDGKKYRFALKIKNGERFREVTAWIAPEGGSFLKIGTLKKRTTTAPQSWQYVYSFVENMEETFGLHSRRANFGNQWCMYPSGEWKEYTTFRHTVDEMGKKGVRRDHSAGVGSESDIFLKMGGFKEGTPADVDITRKPSPPNYMNKLQEELNKST